MTLDQASIGQIVVITEIKGGTHFKQRLIHMGLSVGEKLTVVKSGPLGGPLIVRLMDNEFVIGRGMAKKIIIESNI